MKRPQRGGHSTKILRMTRKEWLTIMQLLLTDVTAEPFPQLLKSTILAKIGMQLSTHQQSLPPDWAKNAAGGYRPNGEPEHGKRHIHPEMAPDGL